MPDGLREQKQRSLVDRANHRSWELAQSDPRAALEEARVALREAQAAGYEAGKAAALLNSGWGLIYVGSYGDALKVLHQASEIYNVLGDADGRLKVLNALGVIAHRVGDTERALERYHETLDIARETANKPRLLAALNNLGELSASLHHSDDARRYYEEAQTVAEALGNPATKAVVKVNLASVVRALGDHERATSLVTEGIALAREGGDRISEAEGMTTLGRIHADEGDYDAAERLHREALALVEHMGHPRGVINVLNGLGSLCLETGRLADASRFLQRASDLAEEIGIPLDSVTAYERLASVYEETGDLRNALAIQKRLYELHRRVGSERAVKRLAMLRTEHELEQSRANAEIFRLRNIELREKTLQLKAANHRMNLINDIAREITASLDLDELAGKLYEWVNALMDASVFGIAFYDDVEKTLDYSLFIEDAQRLTPFVRSVDSTGSFGAWAIRNRKEIVLGDSAKEFRAYVKRRTPLTKKSSNSLVYIPLMIEDRVVGVLTVQSQRTRAYSEEQVELLRALAAFIAIAVDNSRKHATIQELNAAITREKGELEQAYDRIAHMANHDNLTELPNRRLLKELLNEHIPLARRQRRKFGILYVDLDDFKPVNDTFGHATGDAVLVRVAGRLRSAVRSSDTVARLGGDEFVLLVRDIDGRLDLETIAEKVLEVLARPIPLGEQMCAPGASIGAAVFPDDGESGDALLSAADTAMYSAKQHGKLNVVFASRGQGMSATDSSESSISSESNVN